MQCKARVEGGVEWSGGCAGSCAWIDALRGVQCPVDAPLLQCPVFSVLAFVSVSVSINCFHS